MDMIHTLTTAAVYYTLCVAPVVHVSIYKGESEKT